jgi:hypothetical protein
VEFDIADEAETDESGKVVADLGDDAIAENKSKLRESGEFSVSKLCMPTVSDMGIWNVDRDPKGQEVAPSNSSHFGIVAACVVLRGVRRPRPEQPWRLRG